MLRERDVAILHEGRCGSTVLEKMVNQNWSVHWAGEIFEAHSQSPPTIHGEQLVAETIGAHKARFRSFGLETKYHTTSQLRPACIGMSIKDYVALLRSLGIRRFITINRDNILARLVSADAAIAADQFHRSGNTASKLRPIEFRTHYDLWCGAMTLAEYFDFLAAERDELASLVPDALALTYEADILSDPLVGYGKVRDFLRLQKRRPKISLRRTATRPLTEMLTNYGEVRDALAGTRHEWMTTEAAYPTNR